MKAERAGLVSRIIPVADLMDEAVNTADTIANMSLPTLMSIKDAVRRTQELPLTEEE